MARCPDGGGRTVNLTDRPLSELYRDDQRRLHAREVDVIIARHRMNIEAHRLLAETKPFRKDLQMTRREELMRNMHEATTNLTNARQSLEDAKFLARNGMANNLTFCTHVEASAFHNWLKAGDALKNFRG
jgi:hypothetical protein